MVPDVKVQFSNENTLTEKYKWDFTHKHTVTVLCTVNVLIQILYIWLKVAYLLQVIFI